MTDKAQLGPEQREAAWTQLSEREFDVLVIGGGVTGAGVALDATTRGLRTALVEARDFASGTSSRSSKLFHGGLRYLEQLDFGLVREALRERELMLTRIAPHLVHPVSFLYPLTRRAWERPYVGAGLALYDTIGGHSSLPRHRHLSRRAARALSPCLRRDSLIGAVQYYDAQGDDARHTLAVVRTAAHYDAVVRSSTEVIALLRSGGRVVGATVRDVESGEVTEVRARVVISATGVWSDDVQRLTGSRGRVNVRASKGIHLVVPRDRIASETGIILRTATSVLFVIPWGNRWLVGTTDTDWEFDKAHPAASGSDITYVLEQVNRVLAVPLTRDDVIGVYAGLRPLLSGESEDTSQLSREHSVSRPVPGLVAVAGGKYTTYRIMARDALEAAGDELGGSLPPCVTDQTPLIGADGYRALVNAAETRAAEHGIPTWRYRRLLDRYGSDVADVLAAGRDRAELMLPVPGADDYLMAELNHAVTHEGALHLDDLLARRTRISIETEHRGVESAPAIADLVAPVLGWNTVQRAREVERYQSRVEAERASQEELHDGTAISKRLTAVDSRQA